MPKEYCVIGYPIAHSLSPAIHNALYREYGLNCRYTSYPVTSENLPDFISQISQRRIHGFNVTMPLKKKIIPYLKTIAPNAQGGVNTVVAAENGLHGYSTDAQGFSASLHSIGTGYQNKNIVFIGAGAVTQALCKDAAQTNAKHIVVLNRTIQKAQAIAKSCNGDADSLAHIDRYMEKCNLLVNTTPLGMTGNAHDFENLGFLDLLPPDAVVCDLIYSPARTAFLKYASARGLTVQNGLGMLIWQAFFAFEKFCGILPTENDYLKILNRLDQPR